MIMNSKRKQVKLCAKQAICASLLLGLSSAVFAQDWSGFYIGPQVSYSWMSTSWQFNEDHAYTSEGSPDSFSTSADGFTVGPHVGWTHKIDSWVFGIEGAYNSGSFSDKETGVLSSSYPNDTFNTKVSQIFTVTPLFGYAQDSWLFYGKGGYASGNIDIDANSQDPHAGTDMSDSQRQNGWTAGAGIAYQLTANSTLGFEYDYTRFGSTDFTTTTTGSTAVAEQVTVNPINMNTVALVYSHHFG